MDSEAIFKRCPSCFAEWRTREDFLGDAALELNGYKTDFRNLEYGLFFFTHKASGCFSTMALEAKDFLDMYQGPRYLGSKAVSEECPRYCIDERQLARCDAICECAFVREVTDTIAGNQKARRRRS